MYLETSDRRSLFQSRHSREFLPARKRPARTPPSTFLFLPIHLSNSPGTGRPPPYGKPQGRRSPTHPMTFGCCFTVPVRSFIGGANRAVSGRRRRRPYIGATPEECQLKTAENLGPCAPPLRPAQKTSSDQAFRTRRARLRRTQAIFLFRPKGSVSREGIATGAAPPPPAKASQQGLAGTAIDGPAVNRHRPRGRDDSAAGRRRPSFWRCGKLPSIARRRGRRA